MRRKSCQSAGEFLASRADHAGNSENLAGMEPEGYVPIGVAERQFFGLEDDVLTIRPLQWFPVILSLQAAAHHEMMQLSGIGLR